MTPRERETKKTQKHILIKAKQHYAKQPGSEVIKLVSSSTQLSTTFLLLINVKMPTLSF